MFRYDEKRGVRSAADAAEGLACPGGSCGAALWGAPNAAGCFSAISQALNLAVSPLYNCVYLCVTVCNCVYLCVTVRKLFM